MRANTLSYAHVMQWAYYGSPLTVVVDVYAVDLMCVVSMQLARRIRGERA